MTRPIRDLDVPLPTLREQLAELVARQREQRAEASAHHHHQGGVVTRIALLGIKVDSPPSQIRLATHDDELTLHLEVGVHLNLTDASEETLRAMARHLMTAARIKAAKRLQQVA